MKLILDNVGPNGGCQCHMLIGILATLVHYQSNFGINLTLYLFINDVNDQINFFLTPSDIVVSVLKGKENFGGIKIMKLDRLYKLFSVYV